MVDLEKKYDATPLSETNFRIVGTLFFLGRFVHPSLRVWHVPEANDAPALIFLAFCVPTLGLLTILPIAYGRRFHLLLIVATMDAIHWILSTLPEYHAAYWALDDSLWAYAMNVMAIAHVVFTIVIVLSYTRNVIAERHVKPAPRNDYTKRQAEFTHEAAPQGDAETSGDSPPRRPSKERRRKSSKSRQHKMAPEDTAELTPAQQEARRIIETLRDELLAIGNIQKRKTRLRNLQREYHPDKNPPEIEEMVREVFYYVQKWWDDVDGIFAEEFKIKCDV